MANPITANADLVQSIILQSLPAGFTEGSRIFGGESRLDSLALVNLLADVESGIAEEFGRDVVLASDRAMSRDRSPFRDVASLTAYVVELLNE